MGTNKLQKEGVRGGEEGGGGRGRGGGERERNFFGAPQTLSSSKLMEPAPAPFLLDPSSWKAVDATQGPQVTTPIFKFSERQIYAVRMEIGLKFYKIYNG